MKRLIRPKTVVENDSLYAKERLPLQAFRSSHELKSEIRNIIANRSREQWDFCGLKTCGAIIALCFKRSMRSSNEKSEGPCLKCA